MKKLALLSLVLLSLLSACKKDDDVKTAYSVYAKKNNSTWISVSPYTNFINSKLKDFILLIAHTGEETLRIRFKNKGAGTYQANEINANYYTTVGQDLIESNYILSNDASNSLIITSYNEAKNLMTGNFKLSFTKTRGDTFPNTILFTNGAFKLQVTTTVNYDN